MKTINEIQTLLSKVSGHDTDGPKNPGRIDKRVPMWIPFVTELKKTGPLRTVLRR